MCGSSFPPLRPLAKGHKDQARRATILRPRVSRRCNALGRTTGTRASQKDGSQSANTSVPRCPAVHASHAEGQHSPIGSSGSPESQSSPAHTRKAGESAHASARVRQTPPQLPPSHARGTQTPSPQPIVDDGLHATPSSLSIHTPARRPEKPLSSQSVAAGKPSHGHARHAVASGAQSTLRGSQNPENTPQYPVPSFTHTSSSAHVALSVSQAGPRATSSPTPASTDTSSIAFASVPESNATVSVRAVSSDASASSASSVTSLPPSVSAVPAASAAASASSLVSPPQAAVNMSVESRISRRIVAGSASETIVAGTHKCARAVNTRSLVAYLRCNFREQNWPCSLTFNRRRRQIQKRRCGGLPGCAQMVAIEALAARSTAAERRRPAFSSASNSGTMSCVAPPFPTTNGSESVTGSEPMISASSPSP